MDLQLQATFEEFQRKKIALRQIHTATLECFKKIEKVLESQEHEFAQELTKEITNVTQDNIGKCKLPVQSDKIATDTTTPLADILYTKHEQEIVTSLFSERPALIVVGQTNSGKSSIINEILGCRIVVTSDQPCTSRIIKLIYSPENYVHLVRNDGKVIERHTASDMKIPREMIELKADDRKNTGLVTATIEAGLDIDFLKSGLNIIDSPGRDENDVLDKLLREQLQNTLPFIVYIIDGQNLLTTVDKTFLKEITKRNKDLEIFFVVSKIEPQEDDSSAEEDDDEEDEEDEEETVQENKKLRVFEQLVKNGFLTPDENSMLDHQYFHGLSAWKLNDYRRKMKKDPNWNDPGDMYKEYIEAFQQFQSCLSTFSESTLKKCVKTSCQTLNSVLLRCLYFFIGKANALKKIQGDNLLMLIRIREEEDLVHRNTNHQVEKQRNGIISAITETIKDLEDHITEEAKAFQYSEEFAFPTEDGFVTGAVAVDQCREQIEHMVINNVIKGVKETLEALFGNRDNFIEDLEERLRKIEKQSASQEKREWSDASTMLHSSLMSCYEIDSNQINTHWSVKQLLKTLLRAIERFVKNPAVTVKGRVKVGDPQWKATVAIDTLEAIRIPEIADEMVTNLKQHLQRCHFQFNENLDNMFRVLKHGGTLHDDQREALLKFAPEVANLEKLCNIVKNQ